MNVLDTDTAAFIQTGVSISVASANAERLATMARGMGCKLIDGGQRVCVFVQRSQSAELLANIAASRRVACVFSLPSSNRTVQLKGMDAQCGPFDPADLPLVQQHIQDFTAQVVPLGTPEAIMRQLLHDRPDDLVTVTFTPSASFSQTPGPKAGEALPHAAGDRA
ncbi:MAG TPA: hypothetical protein VFY31_07125 [Macromonas sp.]|nr:hypothetical protein [Macromonas sp.]